MDAYIDSRNQILFAGSFMDGQAGQWYDSLIDQSTYHVPSTYTFDSFMQELENFFGGGVTLHSRERSIINLRQTGSSPWMAPYTLHPFYSRKFTHVELNYTIYDKDLLAVVEAFK